MSLPLPQALRVLDQLDAPEQAVQALLADQGLTVNPDQMVTLLASLAQPAMPAIGAWPQGRPVDVDALAMEEHALAASIAQEEKRLAERRGRSFFQAARDYFRDDWPRIWRRNLKEPRYWGVMTGFYGLFMAAGAALSVHHQGSLGWGLLAGALYAETIYITCILASIGLDMHISPNTALDTLKAQQQALAPWTPSSVELRLWRSAPEVHTQVAALMISPIGLRQGDRPMVEAWMRQALTRDDAPDALQRFLQERPQSGPG